MNAKIKLGLVAVLGVIVVGVLLALLQSVPLTDEQRVMEYVRSLGPKSEVSSTDQCSRVLQTQPWCTITKSSKRITRPEWDELLPQAQFFVVEYALIGQEGGQLRHVLVIEQNGQRYSAETFDSLLKANSIVITDTNRELVAKAFVLTTLADYLEQDVTFSNWTQGDWPGRFGRRFTYSITVWTKMQGLRMKWYFAFENNRLWLARQLQVIEYHTGDYLDVPFEVLPLSGPREYFFRGQ